MSGSSTTPATESPTDTLRRLQENVVGIDIHPVAVQLAKATWVMAAKNTILAARAEGTGAGAVSAPIYLGDSMQLRYDTGTLTASAAIELETGETLPGYETPITFSIPKEIARRQADIDQLISAMAASIDQGQDARSVVDNHEMSDECRQGMENGRRPDEGATRRRPQPRVGVLHPEHDPARSGRRGKG